ncbi:MULTISPECIES: DoxX family protein [Priestia]|jgi:uncharacterized membrane protein YphA (DoxX/SURF4 family)|uniref:DoxX family protein n=1 Tax=Priestia TaxID=2800373 RepID=UPI0015CEF897
MSEIGGKETNAKVQNQPRGKMIAYWTVTLLLGVWKVLGVISLIVPGFPRLKEWAHAGIFFLMTGAALSHAFANDYGNYGFSIILPLIYAALNIVSWVLGCYVQRAAN